MSKCTRKGCEKEFKEEESQDNECQFHPGAPVFHEGLKGWSCCKKRVIDFDEFLKIEGCTLGRHSTEKPETPVEVNPSKRTADKAPTTTKDGVEIYGEVPAAQPAATLTNTLPAAEEKKAKKVVAAVEEQDDESITVPEGEKCKRSGCPVTYKDNTISRGDGEEAKCCYHPGEPVFHEGSKGWSCCKRTVLEFDEFLKIKGCKEGKHLFVGSKGVEEELTDCRTDWYQTQTSVILSIFAKNRDTTKVTFESRAINVDIKMKDNKRFKKTIPLFQDVDADNCKTQELSTKVEITLRKANGISWSSLEPSDDIKVWTTFGTTGGGGTVGSKEMHYNSDSPLNVKQ